MWKVENCELEGVKIITPFYIEDNRGGFLKDYEKETYSHMGIAGDISETFVSY